MDNKQTYSPFCHQENLEKKELFLDTKEFCFLCLKETCSNKTEVQNDDTGMVEVCFRSICRYLNINPCSILLKSLKGDELSLEEKEKASSGQNNYDVSVMLCSKCSKLTKNLSELITQLEMTNMVLMHRFEEYYEILVESTDQREDRSKWNIFQETMGVTSSKPVEFSLVEQLRHETRVKSIAKLAGLRRNSVPKVHIKALNIKSPKRNLNHQSDDASQPETIKRRKPDTETFFMEDASSPETILNWDNPSDSNDSGNGSSTKKPMEIAVSRDQHLSQPSSKTNNLTCDEDYSTEARAVTPSVNESIPEKVHSSYKRAYIQYILDNHYKKQETTGNDVYCCLICNNLIKHNLTIKHLINNHQDALFAHKKANHISQPSFKLHCQNLLGEKSYLEATIESNSCQQSQNLSRNCGFCETEDLTHDDWKYHIILLHFEDLEEKLLQLQAVVKVEQDSETFVKNGPYFETCSASSSSSEFLQQSSSIPTSRKDNQISGDNPNFTIYNNPQIINNSLVQSRPDYFTAHCKSFEAGKRYECRYCDLKVISGSSTDFSIHLITKHAELLFASSKLPQLSTTEFCDCCKHVLYYELFISKSAAKDREQQSGAHLCLLCHRSFKKTVAFKYHFAFKHYNNFVNKLIEFQRKLIHKNAKTVVCSTSNEKHSMFEDAIQSSLNTTDTFNNFHKNQWENSNQIRLHLNTVINKPNIVSESNNQNHNQPLFYTETRIPLSPKLSQENGVSELESVSQYTPIFTHNNALLSPVENMKGYNTNLIGVEVNSVKNGSYSKILIPDITTRFIENRYEHNAVADNQFNINPDDNITSQNDNNYNSCIENENFDILSNHCKSIGSSMYECLHCNDVTKYGVYAISVHLMEKHIVKLFNSSKFPQLSEQVFLDCCQQVLQSESENGKREAEKRGLNSSRVNKEDNLLYLCVICNKSYKRAVDFRCHFVFNHYNSFEEKLIQTQHQVYINTINPGEELAEN